MLPEDSLQLCPSFVMRMCQIIRLDRTPLLGRGGGVYNIVVYVYHIQLHIKAFIYYMYAIRLKTTRCV